MYQTMGQKLNSENIVLEDDKEKKKENDESSNSPIEIPSPPRFHFP